MSWREGDASGVSWGDRHTGGLEPWVRGPGTPRGAPHVCPSSPQMETVPPTEFSWNCLTLRVAGCWEELCFPHIRLTYLSWFSSTPDFQEGVWGADRPLIRGLSGLRNCCTLGIKRIEIKHRQRSV